METNRSIETINKETGNLQEQLIKLENANTVLKKELEIKVKEIEVCQDSKKAKTIVGENISLHEEVDRLNKEISIKNEMLNGFRISMEQIRKQTIPDINSNHVTDWYKQDASILKISQLYNTSKSNIINILVKAGVYKVKND